MHVTIPSGTFVNASEFATCVNLNDQTISPPPLGLAAWIMPKPLAGAVGVLPRTEGKLLLH